MSINLSKRLNKVALFIEENSVLADVGTDHGYLPIYLVMNDKISKAYAMDINKMPLKSASENIAKSGYSHKIKTVLSNGLQNLSDDVNCVLICGLGSPTIVSTLLSHQEKLNNVNCLVLQSNTSMDIVRSTLNSLG